MNTSAEVVLKWADGEYKFALKLKQIEELQRNCDAGLGVIGKRMFSGDYRVEDVTETIRLGLIGGGTDAVKAKQLVETYALPLIRGNESSSLKVAQAVIAVVWFGISDLPDNTSKKDDAATVTTE